MLFWGWFDDACILLDFQSLLRYSWEGSPVGVKLFFYEGEVCFTSSMFCLFIASMISSFVASVMSCLFAIFIQSDKIESDWCCFIIPGSKVLIQSRLANCTPVIVWLSPAHVTARDLCDRCEDMSHGLTYELLFSTVDTIPGLTNENRWSDGANRRSSSLISTMPGQRVN